MKTDRELLELAALAAGIEPPHHVNSIGEWVYMTPRKPNWNPLIDDGDALRLAVMLRLLVQVTSSATFVTDEDGNQLSARPHKPHNYDPHAATRSAITRAAAALGKANLSTCHKERT